VKEKNPGGHIWVLIAIPMNPSDDTEDAMAEKGVESPRVTLVGVSSEAGANVVLPSTLKLLYPQENTAGLPLCIAWTNTRVSLVVMDVATTGSKGFWVRSGTDALPPTPSRVEFIPTT
jgi:hypothetical protein